MDNYKLSRDRAQAYFLDFDQAAIAKNWCLKTDEASLYVDFFGRPYRICRTTGQIFRLWEDSQADFEEVLSIFDLLCHSDGFAQLTGNYAPVNSLKGREKQAGVGTAFHHAAAVAFDQDPEGFRAACTALGGKPVALGDMGFRFPVFGPLSVILKFYRADEDFPASLTLLWDDALLRFVHYETVFYMAGFLLSSIEKLRSGR